MTRNRKEMKRERCYLTSVEVIEGKISTAIKLQEECIQILRIADSIALSLIRIKTKVTKI